MTDELTLTRPDDWHVHFRDGALLADTVPPIARVFGRAVAMPNLVPPVTDVAAALAYRARIAAHVPGPAPRRREHDPHDQGTSAGSAATFALPSLYLTDHTTPEAIHAARSGGLVAAKLYPAGATTHSAAGVTRLAALDPVLAAMADAGLVLQVHGEVTDPDCDVFEREARFVDDVLAPLCLRHPDLRVVLEHVTSARGVAFVRAAGPRVAATITAHHLAVERNDLFRGGLRPHLYCLPVPKTRADRDAVLAAALSGEPRFFLGSDSAPHARHTKESGCCPAGVYSGAHALEHYAAVFDRHGALDRLEAFASFFGADWYGLPRNADTITLARAPLDVPATLPLGAHEVVPYRAGETLPWRVTSAARAPEPA